MRWVGWTIYGVELRAVAHINNVQGVSLPDGADETQHRNGLMLMPWKGERGLLSYVISICQPEWEDLTPLGETTSSCRVGPLGGLAPVGNSQRKLPCALMISVALKRQLRLVLFKIQYTVFGEYWSAKWVLGVTQIISESFLSFSLTRLAHKSAGLSDQTSCQLSLLAFRRIQAYLFSVGTQLEWSNLLQPTGTLQADRVVYCSWPQHMAVLH